MNDTRKKRICLLLSEDVINNFVKKTKQTGLNQGYVVEKLLEHWTRKTIDTGTGNFKADGK